MTPHLSTLTLHRLRYGELATDAQASARAHLEGCARCRQRLGAQERTREAFVLQPIPPAIRALSEPPRPRFAWVRQLLPGLALAAVALTFVAVPALREVRPGLQVEEVRTKGAGPALEVWVDRDGVRAVRDTDVLSAGDRIQVVFDPRQAAHVTIAGRDPTGAIEVWGTVTPERPGMQPAPFALTLDATPGYQEVFVVASPWPLTRSEVERAVEGRPLPNGIKVDSVLLPKR